MEVDKKVRSKERDVRKAFYWLVKADIWVITSMKTCEFKIEDFSITIGLHQGSILNPCLIYSFGCVYTDI